MIMTIEKAIDVLNNWNTSTAEERATALDIAKGCLQSLANLGAIIDNGLEADDGK